MEAQEYLIQEADEKSENQSCFANCPDYGEDEFTRSEVIAFANFFHKHKMQEVLEEMQVKRFYEAGNYSFNIDKTSAFIEGFTCAITHLKNKI